MAHSMRFLASRRGGAPPCDVPAPVATESSSSAATRSAKFIAVDLISGATPLHKFVHEDDNNSVIAPAATSTPTTPPPQPLVVGYLFGPEDGTLSAEVLAECDDAVYIPTKGSMNLAATVNVLLYDRQAKHLHQHPERLEELSADATGGRSINNHHSASQLR
ncbi:tRNA rRNA methyltransferase, putative [Bodo saltans]|uniref:tRNA rRNA methyltransferase, putative n=1 Tax=Bodo saltans TaxID=75058 RepID=A0A0S4IWP9_BODSA|nr:tRNA rRNA methyltransferase, putative [Bodo saltans]|eukprot:CUG05858.1 tRNA rRNA methyltransferase, putative [Bodo saltans]